MSLYDLDELIIIPHENANNATNAKRKFKRTAQAKWDRRHLVTISTHLTKRQWETLRRICRRNDVTIYGIVRDFLLDYMRTHASACERIPPPGL